MAFVTESEFAQHVNSTFQVKLDTDQIVQLELTDVKTYAHKDEEGERPGLERFSLYFRGPNDAFLPQQLYALSHDKLGELEIFLVPIAQDASGFRYEAVFNFWTD